MSIRTRLEASVLALLLSSSAFAGSDKEDAKQYLKNTRAMIGSFFDGEIIREMTTALARGEPLLGTRDEDVVAVKADLAALQLKKRCAVLAEPLEQKLSMGTLPSPAELDAWQAALDAFVKRAPPDLAQLAASEGQRLAEVRTRVAALQKARDERASAERVAQQTREREREQAAAREKLRALGARAQQAGWAVQDSMAKGEAPSPEQLAALESAATELDALQPGAGAHVRARAKELQRRALWSQPDPAAQEAIASSLGAELAARGTQAGKAFSTTFPVMAGQCYLLVTQFDRFSGAETAEPLTLSAKSSSAVQPFSFEAERDGVQRVGLCATAATQVTVKSALTFAGTKNGLRFALLRWARAQFPAELQPSLVLGPIDDCDPVQWRSLWKEPVPGTLVYASGEPHLVIRRNDTSVEVFDVATGKDSLQLAALSTTPPSRVAFRTQFLKRTPPRPGEPLTIVADSAPEYWCAPDEKTPSAAARSLYQCRKAVEAKFGRAYAEVERIREQAARMGGIAPKAEAMSSRLDEDSAAEDQRRCGPIEQKITAAMERTYNELVDDLSAGPR